MRIALVSTPFLAVPPRLYGGTELVVHELTEGLVARGHEVVLFATGDSRTSAELRSLYPQAQWPPEMLTDLNHVSWAMQQIADGSIRHHPCAFRGRAACGRLCRRLRSCTRSIMSGMNICPRSIDIVETSTTSRSRRPDVNARSHSIISTSSIMGSSRRVPMVGASRRRLCLFCRVDFRASKGRTSPSMRRRARVHRSESPAKYIRPTHRGQRRARHRLLERHVGYMGSIGLDQKRSLLRDARALLLPIEWNEPFGLIIIEAMLSGCPVVAFQRGSVAELVEEGLTGFVARDIEHMASLVRPGGAVDSFNRQRCRERAVERFSRDRMVADHVSLYERIRRSMPIPFSRPNRAALARASRA